jgi:hypothetical protein
MLSRCHRGERSPHRRMLTPWSVDLDPQREVLWRTPWSIEGLRCECDGLCNAIGSRRHEETPKITKKNHCCNVVDSVLDVEIMTRLRQQAVACYHTRLQGL